ncbi:MAG: hypothetical protein IFNCLDLE_02493 [Ignavibacteriaceae bacterium]|nr:hypothetical protein [Ignavibacteriaceae bacterium]MBZ0195965.1 hypothetical protein [Ignavibacteriaceae bacterium]
MTQINRSGRNILFIGGSLNQTTMMHKISKYFTEDNLFFTPFYGEGYIHLLRRMGLLDFSILGGRFFEGTMNYFKEHNLKVDYRGRARKYDLVFTCQDIIFPKNIRNTRVILVQEGMTDPEKVVYHLVRFLRLPRYAASTSMTGLSHAYDRFCIASEGYREHFINKGVNPDKLVVTGIPNFDDCAKNFNNNFPHKNFVLVATSDTRETYKYENRKKFIKQAIKIANGRQLIFKLHPNEKIERAIAEIKKLAPNAIIYSDGNIDEMIANCDVLVTKYSSTAYIGLILGKEVHSYFDLEDLKKMIPIQNGGDSARQIAQVGLELLQIPLETLKNKNSGKRRKFFQPNASHPTGRQTANPMSEQTGNLISRPTSNPADKGSGSLEKGGI